MNLKSLSVSDLHARLRQLEASIRQPVGYAHNPERLAAEWRATSDELNRRPREEVLTA